MHLLASARRQELSLAYVAFGAMLILTALGLTRHLDFVIDSSEVGVEKPDPKIFRIALERLGVEAEFLEGKWDGLIAGLDANRYDAVINQVGITEERKQKYDFSEPYIASKAALDAFSRCAQAEFSGQNIAFTTINMPLVKTAMIAPTKMYESVPTISPEEAADFIIEAIIERPTRIATRLGVFASVLNALAPKAYEVVMNTAFQLFPDSAAAQGKKALREERASSEQIAFAALMRGVHW